LFAGFTDKVGVVELSIRKREMSKNFREFWYDIYRMYWLVIRDYM
jgi:hypothetical protein